MVARKYQMNDSYSLKYRIESYQPNPRPPIETRQGLTIHLWRSGNKLRVDQLDARYDPPRTNHNPLGRRITCQNCERDGYGLVTDVLPGSPKVCHSVMFRDLKTNNVDYNNTNFDWRYYGLCNTRQSVYLRMHIVPAMTRFLDQSASHASAEPRGSNPCLVIKTSLERDERSTWFSERDGFNPVFYEYKIDVGRGPEVHTTEVEWQTMPGGHFFPKKVRHTETLGGQLKYEEIITVTHADFHTPVDPAVFTFAGLGLNDGQELDLPEIASADDYPHWRNGKVDYSYTAGMRRKAAMAAGEIALPAAVQPLPEGRPQANYPEGGSWALVAGILAGVSSLVTLVAALIYRRRRTAA